MMWDVPVAQMRNAGRPSLDALTKRQQLKGVSPNDVPYSDDERAMARARRGDELTAREDIWTKQQQMFPFGPRSRSPVAESQLAERLSPSWSRFMDHYADVPYLAAGRGMRGNVDLVGEGPGTGTGIGRWVGQAGRFNTAGSFTPDGPGADLETLMDDANNDMLRPNDRQSAMRALTLLTRGR